MKISDFKKGWIIGNFEPSLLRTEHFEVGLRWNEPGATEPRHFHKVNTEYVVFAGGVHRLNGIDYSDGDVLVIPPYVSSDYLCLEPGYCLTARDFSIPDDKYLGSPVNVVIPTAGRGQRFKDAGFKLPKPLIPIDGEPMIKRVMDNFTPGAQHRMMVVSRADTYLGDVYRPYYDYNTFVVQLDHETEGAVSTMLEVEARIGREDPLIIANCDQLITGFDIDDFMDKALDCSVTVFGSTVPHHSYVQEENGRITRVAEKEVISNKAICGVYFYRKAKYYFDAAHRMIEKNIRVNGEFYNSPVFNEIIAAGLEVNTYSIPQKDMHILGTPEELKAYNERSV